MDNSPEKSIGQEYYDEKLRPALGIAAMVVGIGSAALSAISGTHIHDDTLVIKNLVETAAFTANGAFVTWGGYNMARGRDAWTGQGNEQ
jgi:hypothetical protein